MNKQKNIKALFSDYIDYRESKGLYTLKEAWFRYAIKKVSFEIICNSTRKHYTKHNTIELYKEYLARETGFKLNFMSFKWCLYNKNLNLEQILNRPIKRAGRKVDNSFVYIANSMYNAGYSIAEIARKLNKNYTSIYRKINLLNDNKK